MHHRDTESTEKSFSVSSPRAPQGGPGGAAKRVFLLCVLGVSVVDLS
jgi:hypothetical protein